MTTQDDYSALDKPELIRFVFYPRQWHTRPPQNATDYVVPVASDVSITCRFYVRDAESPTILYFHGNGEVVADHDSLAPLYNQRGINLFVADYRGYGASTGSPSFSSMVEDAHPIFDAFTGVLNDGGFSGKIFVMGRSLGSVSAIELASTYPDQISGLIIESGFASTLRLMTRLGFPQERLGIRDPGFPNLTKIRTITMPTLIIHGEVDSLIPFEEGRDLYDNAGAESKRILIIPNGDHNTLLMEGMAEYFKAIEELVFAV
ncbi:MAG: alpha/beta hydrolase [Dehalococcoidia bacterium]|nr:alpha/beta hydrolase [Dehalococcoidia bacterium]